MKKRQELIATKVSSEAWLRLNNLAQHLDISVYQLVQLVVDTLVAYMDKDMQLSPDMEKIIDCFENFEAWGDKCSITDVGARWQVKDALYFFVDSKDNGKTGHVPCWCKNVFFGKPQSTYNKKDILDMVLQRLFPDLSRRLQLLALQAGTASTCDTLEWCLRDLNENEDRETIRELFADCGRTDYGKPTELTKFVRHNRKNPETIGQQHGLHAQQLDLFESFERQEEQTNHRDHE